MKVNQTQELFDNFSHQALKIVSEGLAEKDRIIET